MTNNETKAYCLSGCDGSGSTLYNHRMLVFLLYCYETMILHIICGLFSLLGHSRIYLCFIMHFPTLYYITLRLIQSKFIKNLPIDLLTYQDTQLLYLCRPLNVINVLISTLKLGLVQHCQSSILAG